MDKAFLKVIEIAIFCNLLFIISLFKVKELIDFLTKFFNLILSNILSALLLLSSVCLGLLYELISYSNEEEFINYNDLDELFWMNGKKYIKFSNDFQSLIYGTKKYVTEEEEVIDNDESNINFLSSPILPESRKHHIPNLHKLRWWKPNVDVINNEELPELIEVEKTDISEDEKPESQSSDFENDNLSIECDQKVIRKRSMFFKNSKLKLAFGNQDFLQNYSKQLNNLKTSKSLLKFGPDEYNEIDLIADSNSINKENII